jgi:hypothetical protein
VPADDNGTAYGETAISAGRRFVGSFQASLACQPYVCVVPRPKRKGASKIQIVAQVARTLLK